MRLRLHAILLPCAAVLALSTLRCGGDDAGAPNGPGDGNDAATSPGQDGGTSGGDSSTNPPRDGATGGSDAWMAPDVGKPGDAGDPGQVDITFEVHADKDVHAISPYIYGVNDGSKAATAHATMVRSGGNRLTAYNWENNASNAGSDYQFENDDYMCSTTSCKPSNDAPGAYLGAVIDEASAAGAATLLTVPIVDYVAADKSPAGDVRNSGGNYLSTRFKQNKAKKGSAFTLTPDPSDAFVYEDEMVNWVTKTRPNATVRWLLDNEPDLWSSTHAEIHKDPVTYAELAQRNVDYATAIKAVVPNAQVFGPVNYGWAGYVNLQNAPDAQQNGDFIEWWLGKMKAAEASAGKRLVDGLDLHWYPEAQGDGQRIITDNDTPGLVEAREQAPRSLWDTSYTETSWITQYSTNGPIYLIPRMQAKIAKQYPGTKLSFTEWNYGGGPHVSGAIATADVLGVFGREGVDMAMLWPMSQDESFTYAAFQAFRDFDGAGGAFGDTSVQATTTNVHDATVYASLDSGNAARLVIVAINKATADKIAGVRVFHSTVYTKANVYTITAAGGAKLVKGAPLASVASNAFRVTMPAQSISVIVPTP